MRVALIQMEIALGEPEVNRRRAAELIRAAAAGGARLVVLPEMWTTGYCLDTIGSVADSDLAPTSGLLGALAQELGIWIHGGSVADKKDGKVYNRALVCGPDGRLVSSYQKVHLVPMMDEHLYLGAGESLCAGFDLDGMQAATAICYDLRFPELFRALALRGAQLIVLPAQWPSQRLHHWRTLVQARAIENQCYMLACNRVGQDQANEFPGHSLVVDPWGQILAEGGEAEEAVVADLDLALVGQVRERVPVFRGRRPELY